MPALAFRRSRRFRGAAVTAVFLGDELGPRGKRKVRIATFVATAALLGLLGLIYVRFEQKGQFDGRLWRSFRLWSTWRFLLQGLAATVRAAAVAMAFALALGMLMALGRLARSRPVRWGAGLYVEVFRAYPLLLLILFAPKFLREAGFDAPEPFWALVLALTLYNGAILAEIVRAGILSLDRGQGEAASALGMTYWQSMGLVVLPQALRRMIPATVSQLVTLLKDTSLGALIFYDELLRRARQAGNGNLPPAPLQYLLVAGMMYLVVNLSLSRVARWLEFRQRRRYQAGAIAVAGVEDLAGADPV